MVKTRHSAEVEDSPVQFISLRRVATRRTQNYEHAGFSSGDSDGDYNVKGMTTRRKSSRSQRSISHNDTNKRRRVCIEESADEASPELQMVQGSSMQRNTVNGDSFGVIRRSARQKKPLYDTLNQSLIIDNAALGLVDVKGELPSAAVPTRQRRQSPREVQPTYDGDNFSDMYSRVKRKRQQIKQDMYGIPILDQGEETEASETDAEDDGDNTREDEGEDNDKEEEDGDEDDDEDDDDEEDDDDDHPMPPRRSYYLREHKPRTQIYEAPPIEPQLRRSGRTPSMYPETPSLKRKGRDHQVYRSPARRNSIRRKAAFHGSSSTSSDSSSSDDESRFERRKTKSMAKARNRCLPMNLDAEDVSGLRKERARIGSSLADVDPMALDRSVTFESVGGLGKHVRALKEMVVFPLLYPEVFERFKISPPRGVLFYGPPGTGKTLVARALANECSHGDKRVAFFMRKGADCLSKWVGESERQLRLLFDQAYQMRPSIVFFDEIDGLAPVRSSRQDQIHSSIVSTLLALMDGLDSRGEIVVIGATNRIDSIDPALRRPGRFDREFLFPLPSVEARQQILKIHTTAWTPKVSDPFLGELAERCVGYCGADLKALCTEAALLALRRRYPQIYTSAEKLQLDVSSINVSARDFCNAMQVIVPTAQRSVTSPARALSKTVAPLLRAVLQEVLDLLQTVFPSHIAKSAGVDTAGGNSGCIAGGSPGLKLDDFCSDEDDDAPSIFEHSGGRQHRKNAATENFFSFGFKSPITHRPRLMLSGKAGQGQTSHLAPAVLHHLERLPVHILDLPALFACSAKSPEESCAQVFREAKRTAPSVLFMPHIDQWWSVLNDTLQATFLTLVQDMDPSAPVLLLATSDSSYLTLERILQELFDNRYGEVMTMKNPTEEERREFFADLLQKQATKPPSRKKQAALRSLEVLPKAAPAAPRELTAEEKKKMEQQEEATNRELRLFLRDALNKIARDRKFNIFAKPVDIEEVPDYYEIVKRPMDLSTMMSKIDLHLYQSVKEFLADIGLICSNALEYNPDKDPSGRAIRHRACALRDTAHSIVENELDPEFEKLCKEMVESRQRRGAEPPSAVPDFYFTKPIHKPLDSTPPYPCRFSKRARGMEAEDISAELTKKSRDSNKKCVRLVTEKNTTAEASPASNRELCETPTSTDKKKQNINSDKPKRSAKKPYKKPKCVWNYKSRRRRKSRPAISIRPQTISSPQSQEKEKLMEEGESSPGSDEEEDEVTFGKSPKAASGDAPPESMDSDDSETTVLNGVDETPSKTPDELTDTPAKTPSDHFTPTLPSAKYSDKTSPVSKRDLDFSDVKLLNAESTSSTVLDSGIGSSMESNCESMDSVDQLKHQTGDSTTGGTTQEETAQDQTGEHNIEETPRKPVEGTDVSPASFRRTRSRSSNKEALHALQILEEPEPPLVVDRVRLDRLLNVLVSRTEDYTVERLGKLYSVLSRCVFHHRRAYNKTQLVQDLESEVNRYTSETNHNLILPSTSTHHH